jgi:tetratricopeptide (TPR) repeat protein
MRSIYIFIWLCCVAGTLLRGQTDPFSPTVTRQASEAIQRALEKAGEDPEEGIAVLTALDPEKAGAAVDFTLGNLYFQAAQYTDAAAAYEKALQAFPNFRNAKINLGRVYFAMENVEGAIELYQELVRDGIADGETYLWLGHGLMMKGEAIAAETAYRQCLLLDQNRVEAKQGLLNCLVIQQREREALGLVTELLKADVNRGGFWGLRVNAQLSLADQEAALWSLETARRLGAADGEMLALLGELYLVRGMDEEAVASFEEAGSKGGLSLQRREQMVSGLINAGRLAEAERLLSGLVPELKNVRQADLKEAEGRILKLQSQLLMAQGQAAEAGGLLTRRLAEDPLNGEILGMLAEIQQEQGEYEAAMMLRERQLRISGFEAEALLGMGLIEAERSQWAKAVGFLERAQVFEEKPQVARYLQQLRRMVSARGGE